MLHAAWINIIISDYHKLESFMTIIILKTNIFSLFEVSRNNEQEISKSKYDGAQMVNF
jgi:hypothetical protein